MSGEEGWRAPEFSQTPMGRAFYERDIPAIAKALQSLSAAQPGAVFHVELSQIGPAVQELVDKAEWIHASVAMLHPTPEAREVHFSTEFAWDKLKELAAAVEPFLPDAKVRWEKQVADEVAAVKRPVRRPVTLADFPCEAGEDIPEGAALLYDGSDGLIYPAREDLAPDEALLEAEEDDITRAFAAAYRAIRVGGQLTLADWLRGQGREIEDQRRVWVQPSLTHGQFLAGLEEGPTGHGKVTFWGKANTPEGAIRGALAAWKADGEVQWTAGADVAPDRLVVEPEGMGGGRPRPLQLAWGEHERDGGKHTEWLAPCGCSYHPEGEQGPHVHQCTKHRAVKP